MDKDFEVVILSACRTPIGSFGGALKDAERGRSRRRRRFAKRSRAPASQPADVGDVVMGCVLQAGAGMNVARQAALKAGLPVEVPGETVNRVCGSGLQAVVHAVEAIRVGYVDTMVAGGTESMSNAPYLLKGARWGYRMGNGEAIDSMLARRTHLRDRVVPHGHHGRGGRGALRRVARRSGRLCRREPAARGARDRRRALQGRDRCRCRCRSARAIR